MEEEVNACEKGREGAEPCLDIDIDNGVIEQLV